MEWCVIRFLPRIKLQRLATFSPPRLTFIDEFTAVCQKEFIHRIPEMTNKPSNSSDQERLERPVSPSYGSYPAISPQSFPCRPGSSILIDGHSEVSTVQERAQGKNLPKADVRISFAY